MRFYIILRAFVIGFGRSDLILKGFTCGARNQILSVGRWSIADTRIMRYSESAFGAKFDISYGAPTERISGELRGSTSPMVFPLKNSEIKEKDRLTLPFSFIS